MYPCLKKNYLNGLHWLSSIWLNNDTRKYNLNIPMGLSFQEMSLEHHPLPSNKQHPAKETRGRPKSSIVNHTFCPSTSLQPPIEDCERKIGEERRGGGGELKEKDDKWVKKRKKHVFLAEMARALFLLIAYSNRPLWSHSYPVKESQPNFGLASFLT